MATVENVKDKLRRLIDSANTTTGGAADTVAQAVEQLQAGYGAALTDLSVVENGTYTPDPGMDGFGQVDVQVPDRYQEGYDTGHGDGYNEALAEYPERTEADVWIAHVDLGTISINIPAGRYQEIGTSLNFTEPLPPYWTISPGETVKKLYFNTEWYWQVYGFKTSLDDILRDAAYSYFELSGLRLGQWDLLVGDMEDGQRIVCAAFDLTVLQPGLYVIGAGNLANMTVVYSTQDFDFTAQGLPAGKAGWNTVEADFPCTIANISDTYALGAWGLVSKVPVRFGADPTATIEKEV